MKGVEQLKEMMIEVCFQDIPVLETLVNAMEPSLKNKSNFRGQ
jgi:hypothetical protein